MDRRRSIIAATIVLGVICIPFVTAFAQEKPMPDHYRVYVGTYTQGASEGIYLLDFDASTGELTMEGLAAATENPSYLAIHPVKPMLYAVGEMAGTSEHPGGTIGAFAIDEDTGLLKAINHESTIGKGPCHVCVAPSGKHVAAANYGGGSIALFPVGDDGSLSPASSFIQHEGSSVNPQRQEGPHAHCVTFDKAGRILIAADLGLDKLMLYRYDASTGELTANDPPFASVAPGSGPRHVVFHPSGRFVYCVNEMGNTVTAFTYDASSGTLTELQTVGTLPDGFDGDNTTAEIQVHPSGNFLYTSNRGHDSIAIFAIDADTGKLTVIGHTPTGGNTPRNFGIDPTGRFLLAANQASDNVVVFRIDPDRGTLAPTGRKVDVATPVCVVFQPVHE